MRSLSNSGNNQRSELRPGRPTLSIYDLAAGGPKLQMKSNAKDEVKKKEAGHYSGLSMRTKRLN
jgi:hypothetical protein